MARRSPSPPTKTRSISVGAVPKRAKPSWPAILPAESFGAALQYFTGSKAHNIALRDRAIRLGFKLNEYGLFTLEGEQRVAGASEEDVYEALGLA